jgi:hypothetical protein
MALTFTEQLKESSLNSASAFVHSYVTNEDNIVKEIEEFAGIKAELYCQNILSVFDTTKFLSIYSDLTSVFMQPDKVKQHLIHFYPPEDPLFIKRNITFPSELLHGHVPQAYQILPGYTTQSDADIKEVFKRLMPLIDRQKFIIRPIRTIMLEKGPTPANVDRSIYYASSDTPNNDWHVKSINEKNSYVIDNGLKPFQTQILYEITLPFISNTNVENLTKIIEDENDLLGTFRSALKDLMLSSVIENRSNINEIRNDKIRPQIETINRKFKLITFKHKATVGASVTAITISLIALTHADGVNFQTLFQSSLLGVAGLGWFNSELKYQTEVGKLKDNPYFLLWKISKAKPSQILKQF